MIITGEHFRRIGEAMFGPKWRPALAQILSRDNRMIRYYCDGHAVPPVLVGKLLTEAEARYAALGRAVADLRKAMKAANEGADSCFRVSGNEE